MNAKGYVWVVCSGTQEVNEVCRVFAAEEEAQAYAATAREWHARQAELSLEPGRYKWYSGMFPGDHRHDLVNEVLAASKEWPFGDDFWCEFFTVEAKPFGAFKPQGTKK